MKHNETVFELILEAKIWDAQEKGLIKGCEKGFAKKFAKGFVKGINIGGADSLLTVVRVRFGSIPKFVIKRVRNIHDFTVWDSLIESAMTSETMEQFVAQLP